MASSSLVVQLKLKCLLKKPTHDDITESKEVCIQQSFGRYKGKSVLRNESPSVYVESTQKNHLNIKLKGKKTIYNFKLKNVLLI